MYDVALLDAIPVVLAAPPPPAPAPVAGAPVDGRVVALELLDESVLMLALLRTNEFTGVVVVDP